MKNKIIKRGIIIGAILAIPFFILLYILEEGIWTGNDGICPYHKYKIQMTVDQTKTICERAKELGDIDGEIKGGGFTCIDGVYYRTNYPCITSKLGLRIGEGTDFYILIYLWIFLAELYGILIGGLIGFVISKTRRLMKLKK